MNALIILANPKPSSFNHALANVARDTLADLGYDVTFHDLCAEDFPAGLPASEIPRGAVLDPRIETHVRDLENAEMIVVVHPNWWGKPPGVMAGWIDRVFRPDRAYRFLEGDGGEGVPDGLLKAKAAVVLNTSDTDPRTRAPGVRRSARTHLEGLRFRPVRRVERPAGSLRRHLHQHAGTAAGMAGRGEADRPGRRVRDRRLTDSRDDGLLPSVI